MKHVTFNAVRRLIAIAGLSLFVGACGSRDENSRLCRY